MEVRKGYKQTEVGVIPEDWECTSVDHLVNIGVLEKPLDGNHGEIHPKSSDFVEYGIPFVMANNVQNGHVDLENCSFIRKEQADRLRIGFSYPGDVLLTHKATIGNTAIVGEISSEYIMLTPQVTYYRVTDKTRLNNYYLRHFFDSSAFQKIMIAKSGGGTRAYIGVSAQRQLPVVLPPTLAEQEAIAEALSDADALIESLETLLAKKRQVKQGAMSELLTGKRRLPNVKQTKRVQTDLGDFPSDWELTPLGSIVDPSRSIRYGIVQPGKYDYQGRFMIRGQDYSKGWVDPSEVFRVSDAVETRYKNARVKTGDLIMTIVGSCGIVETIPEWLDGANLTQTTVRIAILPSKANSQFCKYMLETEVGTLEVNNFMKGAVQPGLNCADVEKFLLPLPSDATEQTAIAEILSDMDAEIRAVEEKLSKARQVKAGMMSELLTGRTRLV